MKKQIILNILFLMLVVIGSMAIANINVIESEECNKQQVICGEDEKPPCYEVVCETITKYTLDTKEVDETQLLLDLNKRVTSLEQKFELLNAVK